MMMINTLTSFLSINALPVWAPADDGGTTGGADESNTSNDTSGEGGTEGDQTTETVLGGDQAGDTSSEGGDKKDDVVLGGNTDDDKTDGDEDGEDKRTDEEKAADAKAAEVPEDGVYEFELPEGVEIPDDKKEFWSKGFKDLNLTRQQAQKMVELQSQQVLQDQVAFNKHVEDMQVEQLAAAKADKDIGGDNWETSTKLANRGLEALRGGPLGDPEAKGKDGELLGNKPASALETLILSTGNGNNGEMIRELGRIGKAFASDTFENGSSHEQPVSKEKSWYGDTTPETKKG